MKNSLIIYYSRSGNTEKLAKQIQLDTKAALLKIELEEAYGNYISSCARAIKEKGKKVSPKFITPIPNTAAYNTIFVGFPIWVQDVPAFISSFLSLCDLKDKTIIPFSTSGGSNISCTLKTLEHTCPNANIVFPLNWGMFKKDDYNAWLKSILSLLE